MNKPLEQLYRRMLAMKTVQTPDLRPNNKHNWKRNGRQGQHWQTETFVLKKFLKSVFPIRIFQKFNKSYKIWSIMIQSIGCFCEDGSTGMISHIRQFIREHPVRGMTQCPISIQINETRGSKPLFSKKCHNHSKVSAWRSSITAKFFRTFDSDIGVFVIVKRCNFSEFV